MANPPPPLEWIAVLIDDVDLSQRVIHGWDKTGVRIQVSFRDQIGGFALIPSPGETWSVIRKGYVWHLDRKINSEAEGDHMSTLSPGDARISADGDLTVRVSGVQLNDRPVGATIRDFFSSGSGYTSVTLSHDPVKSDTIHPTLNGLALQPSLWSYDAETRALTFRTTMGYGELLVTYQTWSLNRDDVATIRGRGHITAIEELV